MSTRRKMMGRDFKNQDAAHFREWLKEGVILVGGDAEGSIDIDDETPVFVSIVVNVTGYGPHVGAIYAIQNPYHGNPDAALQPAYEILEEYEMEHNLDYFKELEAEHGDEASGVFTETFDAMGWELSAKDFATAIKGTNAEKFLSVTGGEVVEEAPSMDDLDDAVATGIKQASHPEAVYPYRPTARAGRHHRVADFTTLPEIIAHSQQEGATHVVARSSKATVYFPIRSGGKYEEAVLWNENGYWHSPAPSHTTIVEKLPSNAETIGDYLAQQAGGQQVVTAGRPRKDPTAWRSTPEGHAKYVAARAEAQREADKFGYDYGIEANDLFKSFHVFMLPSAQHRSGHELRCEVVHPMNPETPGHGPEATRNAMKGLYEQRSVAARRHPSAVYIFTLNGAWKHERVPAHVGMIVRINLGVEPNGHARSGAEDYVITRVDTKHGQEGRVAVKPAHGPGQETWGDPRGYLAVGADLHGVAREGHAVRETDDAEEAGKQYAQDQLNGQHFMDWVREQMAEAKELERREPGSTFPLKTKADYKKLARNMLQQLERDTKRADMDTHGDPKAFFRGLVEELKSDDTVNWLADEIQLIKKDLGGRARETPLSEIHSPAPHVRAPSPAPHVKAPTRPTSKSRRPSPKARSTRRRAR